MNQCPSCKAEMDEAAKFCRNCGMPLQVTSEDVSTLRLPPRTAPNIDLPRSTVPVAPGPTSPSASPTSPAYLPPSYYPAPQPPSAPATPPRTRPARISLGDWLIGGWHVYKENWLLMSLACLVGGLLGSVTLGILAGPLLMGVYRMAFRTMRGEQPEFGDLFAWGGRFLQAFLAFLISAAIYAGVAGIGQNSPVSAILTFIVTPFLTVLLGLTMPHLLERRVDVAAAINDVGRLIFSRDAFMWWVVGLVFSTIAAGGFFGFCVGVFVTLPWMISSAAVAYRDIFGFDDPHRTLH